MGLKTKTGWDVTTWTWRRWIDTNAQDFWIGRLQAADCVSWSMTESALRVRVLLQVYVHSRRFSETLTRNWGGKVLVIKTREWMKPRPACSIRIESRLEIVQEARDGKDSATPYLVIPHGLAFGSGEHATTYLMLRALARHDWGRTTARRTTVLDLGTGSGVLALAARRFGARQIVATDFDADAVRTARQNERLNFSKPLIHWRHADVLDLRGKVRYNLVLANLFSGVLAQAASRIAACVLPGGQLLISGILISQQEEVLAAYLLQGLRLFRIFRRGKWIMLVLGRD